MKPYPLKFEPIFKERVWGGRTLERFGLNVPEGKIGEGWMIGDHPHGTTRVLNGELTGIPLKEIREKYGEALFGQRGFSEKAGRFPLLIKLLDCQNDLSVQVHPSDDYEKLPEGELGKTEMWYVIDAKPDAKIIYGLKEDVDQVTLAKAIEEDTIMDCLNEISVQAGDSFFIPAGTVHALGAGVLVAEIQQNSDTTYRLYDYNRPGLDGKLRELHIDDSLNVIHYDNHGAVRMKTEQSKSHDWLTLAKCPYFTVEKGFSSNEQNWELETIPESFIIHIFVDGSGTLSWEDGSIDFKAGDCFLLPANLGKYSLQGRYTAIRSYV